MRRYACIYVFWGVLFWFLLNTPHPSPGSISYESFVSFADIISAKLINRTKIVMLKLCLQVIFKGKNFIRIVRTAWLFNFQLVGVCVYQLICCCQPTWLAVRLVGCSVPRVGLRVPFVLRLFSLRFIGPLTGIWNMFYLYLWWFTTSHLDDKQATNHYRLLAIF